MLCLRSCTKEVGAQNLLHYDIDEAVGHNKHQDDVSDVYITPLTKYPEDGDSKTNAPCLSVIYHNIPDNGKRCDQRYDL